MEFDHLGVVVGDIAAGRQHLSNLFYITSWTEIFRDEIQQVDVQFGKDTNGVCYELISPVGDSSPVSSALRTKSNILNHLAYRVEDLESEGGRLREEHCIPLGVPSQAVAFGGARIQFFLSRYGFIVELIETNEQHSFSFQNSPKKETLK